MSPKGQPRVPKALTVEHESPPDLFDALFEEFGGFDLDPACRPQHYTARRVLENGGMAYYPPSPIEDDYTWDHPGDPMFRVDGLAHDWNCRFFFCNPPYGLALRKWVPYALKQVRDGHAGGGVMLVPATTDTIWFQDHVLTHITRNQLMGPTDEEYNTDMNDCIKQVRFVRSRLTFSGMPAPADKGSLLLIMGKANE